MLFSARPKTLIRLKSREKNAHRSSAVAMALSGDSLSGSVHMFVMGVLLVVFVAGGGFLYSVNQTAVQGYQLRVLEKKIDSLKQENAELKITEADLRSLYRIEASPEALFMQKFDNIIYLEEQSLLSSNFGGHPTTLRDGAVALK